MIPGFIDNTCRYGPLSSVRFEKLIEGIQDFEKINILRKEYKALGKIEKLQEPEAVLSLFEISNLKDITTEEMVTETKRQVNES